MNLPNISRFGNADLAFEPKTRNMEKQLARSKIDSKFLNYLALFVRVFHPSLFAHKIPYFACKMLQSFHPNRPESMGFLHH